MTATRGRGRPRIGTRVVLTIPDDVLAHIDAAAAAAGHDRADEVRARLAAPMLPPEPRRLTRRSCDFCGRSVPVRTDGQLRRHETPHGRQCIGGAHAVR